MLTYLAMGALYRASWGWYGVDIGGINVDALTSCD